MTNKKPDGATAELNKVKTLDPKNATAYWKLELGFTLKYQWPDTTDEKPKKTFILVVLSSRVFYLGTKMFSGGHNLPGSR